MEMTNTHTRGATSSAHLVLSKIELKKYRQIFVKSRNLKMRE